MKGPMETVKKIGEPFLSKDLKGPLTDSEMQKVVDFYEQLMQTAFCRAGDHSLSFVYHIVHSLVASSRRCHSIVPILVDHYHLSGRNH